MPKFQCACGKIISFVTIPCRYDAWVIRDQKSGVMYAEGFDRPPSNWTVNLSPPTHHENHEHPTRVPLQPPHLAGDERGDRGPEAGDPADRFYGAARAAPAAGRGPVPV